MTLMDVYNLIESPLTDEKLPEIVNNSFIK